MPWRHYLVWLAGIALGLGAQSVGIGWQDPARWVPDLAVGWIFMACGFVARRARPETWSGGLLIACGFAWFIPNFSDLGPAIVGSIAAFALFLHRGLLLHLVLAYPTGRTSSLPTVVAIAGVYAAAVFNPFWPSDVVAIVMAALVIVVSVGQYVGSVRPHRRARLFALGAAIAWGAMIAGAAVVRSMSPNLSPVVLLAVYDAMLCAMAIGLTVGLRSISWESSVVTDLVVELGESRSGGLRSQLARALGDPSLQVGFWLGETVSYVDAEGHPLGVPEPGSDRSMTIVEGDGQPIAVLVHDPAVLSDPGLVEAVSSAAKLAAANARLQAEMRARLAEVTASRRRILDAVDEERVRLERRAQQGALRRLDELSTLLNQARGSAAAEQTIAQITEAEAQLARTQEELRQLARGIHPPELSQHGLSAAITAMAQELPLAVDLNVSAIVSSSNAQACAYFACSEAFANVTKYGDASNIRVSLRTVPGGLFLEIADDGVGGAVPGHGTGLRGLADRVETLGGTFSVDSPPGGGTRLVATIPDGVGAA